MQILPFDPGFEEFQFLTQFLLEVIQNFAFHIGFGGRGKAGHGSEGFTAGRPRIPG